MPSLFHRLAARSLTAIAILASAAPAHADEFVREGRVGAWAIGAMADNNGRFTRCVADLGGPGGMLRLAWFAGSHEYFLSWPSPNNQQFGPAPVTLRFDRGFRTTATSNRSNRPSVKLSSTIVDNLMRANENIVIEQGGRSLAWPLNRQDMTDVFVAVENCVHKHER